MIDTFMLLFTLGAVGFIAVRATILDRRLPWFALLPKPDTSTPTPAGTARRPGGPAAVPAVPPRTRRRRMQS